MTHTENCRVFDFHGFYIFSDSLKHEHQLMSNFKLHTIDDINNLNLHSVSHHDLWILQLNICSLSKKFYAFCAFLSQLEVQPGIICIIEPWLSITDDGCHITEYNLIVEEILLCMIK